MRKQTIFIISFLFMAGSLHSQIINKEPLSPRITGYRIDASLDTKTKIVNGYMDAFWINQTNETVPDIQLHMYMNAFRNSKSTFYSERSSSPGTDSSAYGWINLKSFTLKDGTDLVPLMQFISPDDRNTYDMTVLKVTLKEAVKPGDTVHIKAEFETKLPSKIRRTGYTDDFFFVAQWFPKFGVYEPAGMRYRSIGGWNCHQFHANSEFYSNHSVYDVKITVPKDYIVGSGGLLMSETASGESNKTLNYRAEDIVDFAWTAWPGYAVFTDQWEHVKITLLISRERTEQVDRQFTAVKNALEYLTKNVGPFPWPHLTFVDPPSKGSGAGGMEYTTLFTSASAYKIPECIHMPEMVTVHEFGHAYFMGILANNEFEEPWMDEGINSFWEQRIMDHYYGENSGMINNPLLKVSDKTVARLTYVTSRNRQTVSNNEYSWNYAHGSYGMMSYYKAATWLWTMMGIIGEETTNEVFKEYYRRWAFKHPSAKDFISVVNDVVKKYHGDKYGNDMNWFFDQVLYGTAICDYKVAGFLNNQYKKPAGNIDTNLLPDSTLLAHSDSLYTAVAQLERIGDMMLPVDVLIHFTDGSEVLEQWDGKSRYKDFTYEGYKKIEWVKIDPEYKILMDVNFINNSLASECNLVPVKRISGKLTTILQFIISTITL